ncbi:hypothetical protein GRF29_96g1722108 [Pseudopithomyces chartarum]|uniref:AA9 family lytic polysaccharide monooxygenase n=1 Tax=Pseudopithomyces chartarum TaxID=1892770 RepID=A0AAN6RI86_9PLEO|nr:hypothetical protein GRF29_96g1722108 [Pseudopithomyces chartarum]
MRATTVLLFNAAVANAHWVTSNFIFDNRITGEFEYVRHDPHTAFHPSTPPPPLLPITSNKQIPNPKYPTTLPIPPSTPPPTHTLTPSRPISPIGSASTTDPETRLAYPNTDPDSTDLTCGRNATTHGAGVKTAIIAAGDKYHPGYGSAWLSRAPSNLESYTGDGSWYKIHQTAGRTEQSPPAGGDKTKNVWGTYNAQTWNFTIPATTPRGTTSSAGNPSSPTRKTHSSTSTARM